MSKKPNKPDAILPNNSERIQLGLNKQQYAAHLKYRNDLHKELERRTLIWLAQRKTTPSRAEKIFEYHNKLWKNTAAKLIQKHRIINTNSRILIKQSFAEYSVEAIKTLEELENGRRD